MAIVLRGPRKGTHRLGPEKAYRGRGGEGSHRQSNGRSPKEWRRHPSVRAVPAATGLEQRRAEAVRPERWGCWAEERFAPWWAEIRFDVGREREADATDRAVSSGLQRGGNEARPAPGGGNTLEARIV